MKTDSLINHPEDKYPVLRVIRTDRCNAGTVVLFEQKSSGVVVHSRHGSAHSVGKWHTAWNEYDFEHYAGKITLQND